MKRKVPHLDLGMQSGNRLDIVEESPEATNSNDSAGGSGIAFETVSRGRLGSLYL